MVAIQKKGLMNYLHSLGFPSFRSINPSIKPAMHALGLEF
jgi:hypothetical protein